MLDFGFYNMDCMEGMKEFPDKYFELAIVDPPYGIDIGSKAMGKGGGVAPHTNRSAVQNKGSAPDNLIQVGGGLVQSPKFIRHLMTATHQMPITLKN